MRLEELHNKTICILGFGKEGASTLKALEGIVPADHIVIADTNPNLIVEGFRTQLGKDYLNDLDGFDVVIKSPGIPPHPELSKLREKGTLTSSLQLFIDTVRPKGAHIVGVTGSKGKSTTSALIYHGLQVAGRPSFLIGNIGIPVFDALAEARSGTTFVTEMSSYQLMDLQSGPDIAVVTSFFPEHLDYHGSEAAYLAAKARIAETQTPANVIFYNSASDECVEIAQRSPGIKVACSTADSPISIEETQLLGKHNLSNLALAWKVLKHLGISESVACGAFREFKGLPHRLETVGMYHNIMWIDDAISTTPESTIAALQALGSSVETLIVGGLDRGYTFTNLAKEIVASSVTTLIVLPGSGPAIQEAVKKVDTESRITAYPASTMQEVVHIARAHTRPTKTCLLSTASPSYNMFKNFEEKGSLFQEAVRA